MAYELRYLPSVKKDLAGLPRSVASRVRNALEYLAENPRAGKPLKADLAPFWSYRVADYRIVYEIREREIVVLVVMIGPRGEIYRRARRHRG